MNKLYSASCKIEIELYENKLSSEKLKELSLLKFILLLLLLSFKAFSFSLFFSKH